MSLRRGVGGGGVGTTWRSYPRSKPIGANGFGGAAGAGGAAAGAAGGLSTAVIAITAVVAIVAAVGMAVSTGLWVDNVHTLDRKADRNRDAIQDLESEIAMLNTSFFLDDEWTMANAADQSKQFMFNATLISAMTKRNYAWPDADGVVVLENTLPATNASFPEDEFNVFSFATPSIRISFDLDLLTAARMYDWPNKDGTVAMLSDVIQIAGNTSVFLDSAFAIENDPDTTKRGMFDASQISSLTNRTVSFANADGTMCLLEPPQTLSNKTLDSTNSATLLDAALTLQDDGDNTKQLQFDLAALTTGTLITATIPMFPSTSSRELMFTTGTQLVTGAKTFDDTALMIRDSVTTNEAQFNCTLLSSDQDYQFPDDSGVLVLEDAIQTLTRKTLDNTTTITVLDTQLTVQGTSGDPTITLQLDLDNMTAPRTLSAPDKSGTLALTSDLPVEGTWTPTFGTQVGYTGTPSTTAGTSRFVRIGNTVIVSFTITGLSNPGTNRRSAININNIPIARSTSFTSGRQVNGQATAHSLSGLIPSAGFVLGVSGTQTFQVDTYNDLITFGAIDIHVNCVYQLD